MYGSVPSKEQASTIGQRIFWEGPLFGRLTKSGKEYLVRHGFEHAGASDKRIVAGQRLSFVWPSKSGPQFDINDKSAAHIRPYPKKSTDFIDEKIHLSQTLQGTKGLTPRTLLSPEEALPGNLYFVKHRYGAQGKSVYIYNQQELMEWWSKSKNPQHFLIQEEIIPSLYQGRKFVLRSHILLFQRNGGSKASNDDCDGSLIALLHSSVICQLHSVPYEWGSSTKAAHISQGGGKKLPTPCLLEDLDPSHPAAGAFPCIEACSKSLVAAIAPKFSDVKSSLSADTTCFALLGNDILIDREGNALLCEVNTHPALGWGTMAKVPNKVFDSLTEETLAILIEGSQVIPRTGYRRIKR